MIGSISHKLIDNHIENLNYQYNYYQLEKAEDEIILLKVSNNNTIIYLFWKIIANFISLYLY